MGALGTLMLPLQSLFCGARLPCMGACHRWCEGWCSGLWLLMQRLCSRNWMQPVYPDESDCGMGSVPAAFLRCACRWLKQCKAGSMQHVCVEALVDCRLDVASCLQVPGSAGLGLLHAACLLHGEGGHARQSQSSHPPWTRAGAWLCCGLG